MFAAGLIGLPWWKVIFGETNISRNIFRSWQAGAVSLLGAVGGAGHRRTAVCLFSNNCGDWVPGLAYSSNCRAGNARARRGQIKQEVQ